MKRMNVAGTSIVGQMVKEMSNFSLGSTVTSDGVKTPLKMSTFLCMLVVKGSAAEGNTSAGEKRVENRIVNRKTGLSFFLIFNTSST